MNATILKFGWPATLLREWDHWVLLVRPAQPTLGSLVLAAKSDATAFSELAPAAHAELAVATAAIEQALRDAVGYEKLNYLMLMMADKEVHFHVIPRYDGSRAWNGRQFADAGWPKMPDLGQAQTVEGDELELLAGWLKRFLA
ncbi:HIT family protein [Sphingomonas montana]|uniref:HIT family protein n=1 Tax=Sphingomonas montana TaxID=1843236 RepID=UPI00096FACBE|nr:HIT family protein [Sphingomonas montana]